MNTLEKTQNWFTQAIPEPTDAQKVIQCGCHFEEVHEMQSCFPVDSGEGVATISHDMKKYPEMFTDNLGEIDREELLDSLADQIVTAIGVAHMFGLDIKGALDEVNRSNFSKFEDGKPVFNEHGKISKGKHYTLPDLSAFV